MFRQVAPFWQGLLGIDGDMVINYLIFFFRDSCCFRSASLGECERILDTVQVLLSQQVSLSCS